MVKSEADALKTVPGKASMWYNKVYMILRRIACTGFYPKFLVFVRKDLEGENA